MQGREKDIAFLKRLIDQVDQGGSALVIRGEAGIGKSALLEVAKSIAREQGILVLSMTGVPAESHVPFAGLEQALRPLFKQVDSLAPRHRSALLVALSMGDDTASPDIFLVALATLALLTEGAGGTPILLVIDDAQWIDQPTYDVLDFVSRRLSSDPIVLLVATRDDARRVLGDTGTPQIQLSALDDVDAERLLDAHAPDLPADLRRRFLKEAAGNPLAILELPLADQALDHDDSWLPLTERLERAFSSRLTGLEDTTRRLLFVAAENDGTSFEEIRRAAEMMLAKPVGVDALTTAVAAKLIHFDGRDVRFRHPLVRSAIHQAADLSVRQAIHASLAAIMPGQLDRQLWHRAAAAVGSDEDLAAEHDCMAARAQRRGVVLTAIDVLQTAARLSSTPKSRSERLLRAAELAADLGQAELMEDLLQRADVDESDELASARIGWCREISQPPFVNDPTKIPSLLRFVAQAETAGAIELAGNLAWRAAQRCWWSNATETVGESVVAAAGALGLPDTDARVIAIAAYVQPLKNGGKVYQALKRLATEGLEDPAIARILGSTADVIGTFDLAVHFLNRSSAALREQGRLSDLARVLFSQAWAEMEVGDWIGAMREAEESARLAEEVGGNLWIAAATIVKAKLAGMRGNFEQAEVHAAHVERLLLSSRPSFLLAMLQIARGITAIGAGEHSVAHDHLRRLFTPDDPAFNSGLQFFALADFVEAAAYSNSSRAIAHGLIDQMELAAGRERVPWVETMLLYARALLSENERAEELFMRGLGADANAFPFLRGRLLLAYGSWLRRQRRSASARTPLREARNIFDALGASPWGERAREELRASGEFSRARAEYSWETLSPQELHIAQLTAEGFSNKEIGAKLYLSHRTVGYHLHRIFAKTGITSRSALGPLLARTVGAN
ncbi:helix-turn-helix transcriptional regulator [Mesorhizobium abyssinicae]|uniref:helix-turn-helix transcriptional regulator n=1 Tax=Mesorhizobium abyssinicae TaxID=1209958 RepID=UPI0033940AB4